MECIIYSLRRKNRCFASNITLRIFTTDFSLDLCSKGVESKAFRTRAGRGKPGDCIIKIHEVFSYDCTKVVCFRKEKSLFKALAIKLNWSLEDESTFINMNRKSA